MRGICGILLKRHKKINFAELNRAMPKVKLIFNNSELGAGTRGAGLGSGAMKVAARNKGADFFGTHDSISIEDENNLLNFPSAYKNARYIDGMIRVYERMAEATSAVLKSGDFPVVLAGDHGSAGGTIAGIKKAFPDKRLGVIWIDAHADMHSPYTSPSGNMHGMPLAKALGFDNAEQKVNDPAPETVQMWNRLKSIGGNPDVLPEDVIFMGVRSTEAQENSLIEKYGIKNFTVEELRAARLDFVVNEVEDQLENCDLVYVSFDVDSMDPYLVSHGTGTPVENGLTPEEAEILVRKFSVWSKCCCLEFVEINPCLDDKGNRMAEVAYHILEKVCSDIENNLA